MFCGSELLTGVIEAEVTTNSHFTADTFRVKAALSGLPPTLSVEGGYVMELRAKNHSTESMVVE